MSPRRFRIMNARQAQALADTGQMDRTLTEQAWYPSIEGLARVGGWEFVHHRISKGTNWGWPDYSFGRIDGPPRIMFVEFKLDGEHLTPEQAMWLEIFTRKGLEAYAIWLPSQWADLVILLIDQKQIFYGLELDQQPLYADERISRHLSGRLMEDQRRTEALDA